MIKILLIFSFFLTASQLRANNVVIKTKDHFLVEAEFIGTYMNHVHVLRGDNIEYYNCDEIESILMAGTKTSLLYDCNENSVSEEILFPPELDPMTGEWITIIPDVFNKTLKRAKTSLKGSGSDISKQRFLKKNEQVFKEKTGLASEDSDALIGWEDKKVENIQKTNNRLDVLLNPSDFKHDKNKLEEPLYLTKSEIQTLIKEELQRHLQKRKKDREPSLYERYRAGLITEKELNRIVDGRSPVELLEANLITQEEYNRNTQKMINPFTYIEKYGFVTTATRRPELILFPTCGLYLFLLIFLQ
tara:strand:+ start:57 stop:965 length:909 start_codon:yes stop_codon:yes gene_type:complete